MAKAKNLVTSLGIVTVGEEIDIFVPKVEREIPRSVSGVKAQIIKTGGRLLGYPFGYGITRTEHLDLLYLVGLGKRSSIAFAGEIGFEFSFCNSLLIKKEVV